MTTAKQNPPRGGGRSRRGRRRPGPGPIPVPFPGAGRGPRRSRYGYIVGLPLPIVIPTPVYLTPRNCTPPLSGDGTRLAVTAAWATACFLPAYHRAQIRWGTNSYAITSELVLELLPQARLRAPATAAEQELRRRIELATAILQNQRGIPTQYPRSPTTPRPIQRRIRPAWLRALLTGWP
jgi:hypothetical protein